MPFCAVLSLLIYYVFLDYIFAYSAFFTAHIEVPSVPRRVCFLAFYASSLS